MAHSAVLTWVDSLDAGSTYNIYRSQTSGLYTTPLNTSPIAAGLTTYTDSSITIGTYFYIATAVLNGLESVHSNEVKAVILPSAPTALAVAAN
jgi:hypothetical protein